MVSVLVLHPVAFRQPHRKKNVLLKYAVSKPVKVTVARIETLRKPDCITRDSCMGRAHWSSWHGALAGSKANCGRGVIYWNKLDGSNGDCFPTTVLLMCCLYSQCFVVMCIRMAWRGEQGGIRYLNYFPCSTHTHENVKKAKNFTL
jgi:hypothetical protein